MQHLKHCIGALVFVATTAWFSLPAAAAQAWPQRPVHVIVQVGAGSGVDLTARLYAEQLAARWKQPVIVEDRPGANGLIGTGAFAASHDDHVLLFGPAAPISVFPYVYAKLPY